MTGAPGRTTRWAAYVVAGAVAAALAGDLLVLALVGCGLLEWLVQHSPRRGVGNRTSPFGLLLPGSISAGGAPALAWTAFKVGALSFGGGFVIIPLMQNDAVHVHRWMTNSQFLSGVALGQVTPGPVVATVAAVGYAAHGVLGGLLAALVAFLPSFAFILLAGRCFEHFRRSASARSFLDGAAPAAIGAILGAAVTLAGAIHEGWQFGILAVATIALVILQWRVVQTIVAAGIASVILSISGAPLP